MSLKKSNNFGSSLLGACLAIIVSVPLTAWLGSQFADTYNTRVAIYGGLLLWVIVGAVSIFQVTKNSNSPFSTRQTLLWFISTWLWPIPLLMWFFSQNKEKKR